MSASLSQPRLDEILARLSRERRLSATDLAASLGVSHETIRRDLTFLEENGKLRRVHGGAVLPNLHEEPPIEERSRLKSSEKARLATAAVRLVEEGMTLFLDTGTTTMALARRLLDAGRLSVMTNSLDIAALLARQARIRVGVTPGAVRSNDNAILGHDCVEWVDRFFFDIAFMGIGAIDLDQAFMDHEIGEAQLRRCLVRRCRRSVMMADDSKFGRKAFARTFGFVAVSTLVTNVAPPAPFVERILAGKVELLDGRAGAHG